MSGENDAFSPDESPVKDSDLRENAFLTGTVADGVSLPAPHKDNGDDNDDGFITSGKRSCNHADAESGSAGTAKVKKTVFRIVCQYGIKAAESSCYSLKIHPALSLHISVVLSGY